MYEHIIEKIFLKYKKSGFVTESFVFDVIEEEGIPLFEVEYVMDLLLSKGIIIKDGNDLVNDNCEDDECDRSLTDYKQLFNDIINEEPKLRDLLEYVEKIKPPQKREWQILLPQAQTGNDYAKKRLVEMYMRVAIKCAYSLSKKYDLPLEETIQGSFVGLCISIDKYEIGKNEQFSTYFLFWCRQLVMRSANIKNSTLYFPIHIKEKLFDIYELVINYMGKDGSYDFQCEELVNIVCDKLEYSEDKARELLSYLNPSQSLEFSLEHSEKTFSDENLYMYNLIEKLEIENTSLIVNTIIKQALNSREYEVLCMRYGIGYDKEYTLEMIGKKIGVTRERIRQIEAKALRKLRSKPQIQILYKNN